MWYLRNEICAQSDAAVLALVERDSVQEPQRGELGGPRESRGVPAACKSLPSKSSTPRCDDRRCRRLTMYLVTTDSAALSVPILTLAVKDDPGGWYGFAILWPPPSVTPGTRRRRTHPPRRRGAPTTCRGRCPPPDAHCPRRWPERTPNPGMEAHLRVGVCPDLASQVQRLQDPVRRVLRSVGGRLAQDAVQRHGCAV